MSEAQEHLKIRARGALLVTLLSIFTAMQVLVLVLLFALWPNLADHGKQGQALVIMGMVLAVLAIVGLIGIWGWARWGVYLLVVVATIGLVTDVILGIPVPTLLVRLALLAALATAIRSRWEFFV